MLEKLRIIHFTMWFEFIMFLPNASRKYWPTDILPARNNTHAHCTSLWPANSVYCPVNF